MQGKTGYEQFVYREMQNVMGRRELMEQRAEIRAADRQGQQYLRAMVEGRQQQEHVQ